MNRTLVVAVLALTAACKGKEPAKSDEPSPKPAPGSASAAPPGPVLVPAGSATADERCASPCRFLATTALADLAAEVKKTCGTEWKPAGADDCDQSDYLRNCIYATAGYTFKKNQWKQTFGAEPWYQPRGDFKDADLSKVAQANVAALKQQAKDCRAGQPATPEDVAIIEKWLDDVRAGKPEVPAVALNPGKVDPQVLRQQLIDTKDDFKKGQKTSYRYTQSDWDGALQGETVRTIEFSPGNAEPAVTDCQNEDCEGGNSVLIAIDAKDKIVGVQQVLSACPRVYLGGVYQGEILRNLARPGLERWQGLAVTLPCDGEVAQFHIAEELPEVTELDALELVVDGVAIGPRSCDEPICGNDGVARTLRRGEALDVAFAIPASARCRRAVLRANGHYVPARP